MKFFSAAALATVALAGMAAASESSKCGSGHDEPVHVPEHHHHHHWSSSSEHHKSHPTHVSHHPHHSWAHPSKSTEWSHKSTDKPEPTKSHTWPSKSTTAPTSKPTKGSGGDDDSNCCIKKGDSKKDICSEFQKGGLINLSLLGCSKTDISILSDLLNRDEQVAGAGRERFEKRKASTKGKECVSSQEDKCAIYQSAALINLDILGCSSNDISILSDIL